MKKEKKEKTLFDHIKLKFDKIILTKILLTILFLIFGVVIYQNRLITANAVGIIVGVYFLLFGIFSIYEYFMKQVAPIFSYQLFFGIIAIVLSIFIMINPFKIVKILTFALGIYLIMRGLFKVVDAFKFKKYGYDGWLLILISSIIIVIFGVFTTINPLASLDIIQVAAIFIILSCILELCNLIMVYTKAKDIAKLFQKKE